MSQTAPAAQQEAWNASFAMSEAAAAGPERSAIVSPFGDRTFGELDARANRLARALRRRGAAGQLCVLMPNRPEFAEALYSGLRTGMRVTPINWHLGSEEVAYILADSRATAFIADARFAPAAADAAGRARIAVRLATGGTIDGFEDYEAAVVSEPPDELSDTSSGITMLYTSGTTGRPKGVYRPRGRPTPSPAFGGRGNDGADYRPGEDVHLCTGPLYHAAPILASLQVPLAQGVTAVLMDGWDAAECLRLIDRHRVTHTHMVPTMFVRLLRLPSDVRSHSDLSSLRYVVHGAAPCPVHVKQAMIDWLGPVLYEYYAATEGAGTSITPLEWLAHPGSVGRSNAPDHVLVRGPDGRPLGPRETGIVWLKAPDVTGFRFQYFGDPDKTSRAYDADHFTLGDMSYLDSDGWLYLTDRSADLIISGGVNIYPAEVDAVLITHPDVADACTIGVPNEEWGEEVKAVVELRPGAVAGEQELIDWCRARLAHYKCPRSVDVVDALPRHDTGKLYRRLVRERYRAGA